MGCLNSSEASRRGVSKASPAESTVFLTSTGFVSDRQWARFIQVILKRRGALLSEDSGPEVTREHLVEQYTFQLQRLKVTMINDASYHRPTEKMVAGRSGTGKVGENGNLGRGEGTWLWWDQALEDLMGIPRKNITMIQLLEKPWLFNRKFRDANHDESKPNVEELKPDDEKSYFAALQLTQDAYDALKKTPPQVGAGQAGGKLPGCPESGMNCADELAQISEKLNMTYMDAVDKWCAKYFDDADIVVGQGGEVVMLNMAWQCNSMIADRLVGAVRGNKCVYAGLSASTMVCAKSIEMTNEIQPGWIEAFACSKKFLKTKAFQENDLDDDGTKVHHLGALPLLRTQIAMRPHYSEAWAAEVVRLNLVAEKEFEEETEVEIDDEILRDSAKGCVQACRLLNKISDHAVDQDNPVFVPVNNGDVIEVQISAANGQSKEHFTYVP